MVSILRNTEVQCHFSVLACFNNFLGWSLERERYVWIVNLINELLLECSELKNWVGCFTWIRKLVCRVFIHIQNQADNDFLIEYVKHVSNSENILRGSRRHWQIVRFFILTLKIIVSKDKDYVMHGMCLCHCKVENSQSSSIWMTTVPKALNWGLGEIQRWLNTQVVCHPVV